MAEMKQQNEAYITQLSAEKDHLDESFIHATRLLNEELESVQSSTSKADKKMYEVHNDKPTKMAVKVVIPTKEFPKFNFVGKLLGPAGNTLKQLQQETGTKISILGRGSMKDKKKEEELRQEGGKHAHLNEELHALVEVFAPSPECFSRAAHAMNELRKFLVPENFDEIRQQQMQEMMYLNGEDQAPRGRGAPGPRGRGAPPAPRGRGGLLGQPSRGAPAPRGVPRGAPRGTSTPVRGAPAPRARGAPPGRAPPTRMESSYEQDYGYGYEESYDQGYSDPYAEGGYSSGGGDTQYFDYGHGASSGGYDEGYGGDNWGQSGGSSYGKTPVSRSVSSDRPHPYSRGGRGAPPRY